MYLIDFFSFSFFKLISYVGFMVAFLSIEYWPDPQRGIKEAYRVLKLGGKACLIGPVYPTFWLSRFFADVWMLFPKEEEYIEWFEKAGFKDVQLKRIGPKWYRGVRRHGLIMGCSVTGVKPASGDSPLQVIVLYNTLYYVALLKDIWCSVYAISYLQSVSFSLQIYDQFVTSF